MHFTQDFLSFVIVNNFLCRPLFGQDKSMTIAIVNVYFGRLSCVDFTTCLRIQCGSSWHSPWRFGSQQPPFCWSRSMSSKRSSDGTWSFSESFVCVRILLFDSLIECFNPYDSVVSAIINGKSVRHMHSAVSEFNVHDLITHVQFAFDELLWLCACGKTGMDRVQTESNVTGSTCMRCFSNPAFRISSNFEIFLSSSQITFDVARSRSSQREDSENLSSLCRALLETRFPCLIIHRVRVKARRETSARRRRVSNTLFSLSSTSLNSLHPTSNVSLECRNPCSWDLSCPDIAFRWCQESFATCVLDFSNVVSESTSLFVVADAVSEELEVRVLSLSNQSDSFVILFKVLLDFTVSLAPSLLFSNVLRSGDQSDSNTAIPKHDHLELIDNGFIAQQSHSTLKLQFITFPRRQHLFQLLLWQCAPSELTSLESRLYLCLSCPSDRTQEWYCTMLRNLCLVDCAIHLIDVEFVQILVKHVIRELSYCFDFLCCAKEQFRDAKWYLHIHIKKILFLFLYLDTSYWKSIEYHILRVLILLLRSDGPSALLHEVRLTIVKMTSTVFFRWSIYVISRPADLLLPFAGVAILHLSFADKREMISSISVAFVTTHLISRNRCSAVWQRLDNFIDPVG